MLAANHCCDKVLPVLLYVEGRRRRFAINFKRNDLIVDNQFAGRHGTIGRNLDYNSGIGDRSHVATRVTCLVLAPGPLGIPVCDGQVLDYRQVHNIDSKARTANVRRRNEILQWLAHREKSEFEIFLQVGHSHLLPVTIAKPGMNESIGGLESLHGRANTDGAAKANSIIARKHLDALWRQQV